MTSTSDSQAAEIFAAARSVSVVAANMTYAQAYTPSAEDMAILQAKADLHREFLGETSKRPVYVPVHDFGGALIGHMRYDP